MDEKKITKFAFGSGLLFLFFHFYYRMPDESTRVAVQTVQAVLAVLTVASNGAPALLYFRRKKRFGAKEAAFTALYILQAVVLACYFASGFSNTASVVILASAAVLIVWQSMILNPPKKGGGKP